ncbi:MAG: hypothetical protein ACRDZ8_10575, partial [Acidimicrobiales bacterium]
ARAIAAGHGVTSRVAGGVPLIGVYPPGYPAVLSPFAVIWRSSVLDFRAVSLALYLAVFPLLWRYLKQRGFSPPLRLTALFVLALNPVLATYGTMVMPETLFVVLLLVLLLAAERWEEQAAAVTWAGVATVVCAAGLVWTKEAGLGVVVGVVAWFVWRRRWPKAVAGAIGSAVLVAPLLIVRTLAGASLVGSRYSKDLGGHGGLLHRLTSITPDAAWQYVYAALPHSVLPSGFRVLQDNGALSTTLQAVSLLTAPLVLVGVVLAWRRGVDVGWFAVVAYVAETLLYPYTNERRVILVLPVVVAWYVLGCEWALARLRQAGQWFRARSPARDGGPSAWSAAAGAVLEIALPLAIVALAVIDLAAQFPRDYLFDISSSSSSPGGSGYMTLLRRLGSPNEVVETDYLWTTALYTGHRTANGAYLAPCDPQPMAQAIQADDAGYLLTSSLNGGGLIDYQCLLPVVAALPEAVRLYRADRDHSSVFEMVGPGTDHPGLADLTNTATLTGSAPIAYEPEPEQIDGDPSGQYPVVTPTAGKATFTWTWSRPVTLSQLSFGSAGALHFATGSVQLSLLGPDGDWEALSTTTGAVGPGNATPFVLRSFGSAVTTTAVRVTVAVPGATPAAVHYLHALGPGS